VLTASESSILGQGVVLVSSSGSLSYLCVIFSLQNSLYQNLNKNYNILYLEHLIYCLYVCTCVFLLHQESFDMILVNNSSFYDGGVTVGIRAILKLSARYRTLKMTNNVFLR
jgi:hypothetical protein